MEFDEWFGAEAAFLDQGGGHCFFDLVLGGEFMFLGVFFAGEGDM